MDKTDAKFRIYNPTCSLLERNGLSTRASYVLAKAGVSETQLVMYREISALFCLRNCGSETAKEIWDFMTNSGREVKEVKFEELIPN